MHFELTEQERERAQQGHPVDVIDPQTAEAYILIARERFEPLRPMLTPKLAEANDDERGIPEGIRISQEAFRRALPELLKQKRLVRKWVAYHREKQLGIGSSQQSLLIECFDMGLAETEFYVGWIDPCELIEEEEIEPRLHHYGDGICEDS